MAKKQSSSSSSSDEIVSVTMQPIKASELAELTKPGPEPDGEKVQDFQNPPPGKAPKVVTRISESLVREDM